MLRVHIITAVADDGTVTTVCGRRGTVVLERQGFRTGTYLSLSGKTHFEAVSADAQYSHGIPVVDCIHCVEKVK